MHVHPLQLRVGAHADHCVYDACVHCASECSWVHYVQVQVYRLQTNQMLSN